MHDRRKIRPEPGTELFSSTEPFPERRGDKWQLGFGPTEGSGVTWVLYRRGRGGRTVARRVLRGMFPGRVRLQVWLATSVGPRRATAFLRTIGPLDAFYQHYVAARPDLGPLPGGWWAAIGAKSWSQGPEARRSAA